MRIPGQSSLILVLMCSVACQTADREDAHSSRVLSDSSDCAECAVRLTKTAEFGPGSGSAGPLWQRGTSTRPFIAITGEAQFVVAPTYDPGQVSVFSQTGKVTDQFGSLGEGPGELRHATRPFVTDAGHILIWDRDLRRLSEWSSGLEYSRQYDIGYPANDVIATDSAVFLAIENVGRLPKPPVLVVDRKNGAVLRWIGEVPPARTPNSREIALWRNQLVVASTTEYAIELFSNSTPVSRLVRDPPWLPSDEETRRRFRIIDIAIGEDSALWVLARYPNPNHVIRESPQNGPEGPILSASDAATRSIHVLERIDLARGVVTATGTVRGDILLHLIPGPHVVGIREAESGEAVLLLWSVHQ